MPESLTKSEPIDVAMSADSNTELSQLSIVPPPPSTLRLDLDHTAIFLDVDGTLLDIAPTPLEVRVPQHLSLALERLSARMGGAIAFITGRPVAEIDRIFHPLRMPAAGGHGAEIRLTPKDNIHRSRIATLDDELREDLTRIGELDSGIIVEDKGFSLAIHYRQAPQFGREVMEHIVHICRSERCESLEVLPGKLVVEIKPSGYDKGTGLRELMSNPPFAGRRPIFIGDDVTDNAAFAVLPDFNGIGISVGGPVPGASYNFDHPQDVRLWLERLSRQDDRERR